MKTKIIKVATLTVIAFLGYTLTEDRSVRCIEIPLESTKGGETFGFVDVQKLFDSYPKVQEARQECDLLKKDKKEEISKKDKEVVAMKMEIIDLETKLKTLQSMSKYSAENLLIQTSSPPAPAPETYLQSTDISSSPVSVSTEAAPSDKTGSTEDITVKISSLTLQISEEKALLEEETKKLKELEVKCASEIAEIENSKTQVIMADFYKIISDVAREENISVVVDKASILYGHTGIDLTDKVLDRLRGK